VAREHHALAKSNTRKTRTTIAESAAFSYRFEEDQLWSLDFETASKAETHYPNKTHYRFDCEGWFATDMASVTVWMQGCVQEKNITVNEPLQVHCSKETEEPLRCQLSYHNAVDKGRFADTVLADLRSKAVQEDVSAPSQAGTPNIIH
jgi:hypothetical protein